MDEYRLAVLDGLRRAALLLDTRAYQELLEWTRDEADSRLAALEDDEGLT